MVHHRECLISFLKQMHHQYVSKCVIEKTINKTTQPLNVEWASAALHTNKDYPFNLVTIPVAIT